MGNRDDFRALFTQASKVMRGAVGEVVERHGVHIGQNLVLETLWETDGLTPGEIARRLGVSTPTVVKMANRMAAAGLVTRRRDTRDARLVRVHLTERGRSIEKPLMDDLRALIDRSLAGVGEEEYAAAMSGLAKIIVNLRNADDTQRTG